MRSTCMEDAKSDFSVFFKPTTKLLYKITLVLQVLHIDIIILCPYKKGCNGSVSKVQ